MLAGVCEDVVMLLAEIEQRPGLRRARARANEHDELADGSVAAVVAPGSGEVHAQSMAGRAGDGLGVGGSPFHRTPFPFSECRHRRVVLGNTASASDAYLRGTAWATDDVPVTRSGTLAGLGAKLNGWLPGHLRILRPTRARLRLASAV